MLILLSIKYLTPRQCAEVKDMIRCKFMVTGKQRVVIDNKIAQTISLSLLLNENEIQNNGFPITITDKDIYEKMNFGSMVNVIIELPDTTAQYAISSVK
jgi:hypothetical protein